MKRSNPLVMANRTTFFALMSALVLVWFLTGCMPRGETRTVEQILASAKESMMKVSSTGVPEDATQALTTATTSLDGLVNASLANSPQLSTDTLKSKFDSLARSMETLVNRAGYTARPAFGELIRQYQTMSAGTTTADMSPATIQLLAARTYTLLASELRSTKFSVEP